MVKHRKKKLKRKAAPRRKWRTQVTKLDVRQEIKGIVQSAQKHEGRVVGTGPFIFFSTETGDAWMLELEDNLALCLARDGAAQDVMIQETADQFQVAWESVYHMTDTTFTVIEQTGGMRTIYGYPTRQILQTIQKMQALSARFGTAASANEG
jgi:hypothetical protein